MDGGNNWILLKTYNGEGVVTQFTLESIDIGAFAGQSDVRFRFRLVSDSGYETDGMYVDDVTVIGSAIDASPPLLLYDPPQHYQGVPDTFHFQVTITDLSGVASATLSYWLDNLLPVIITINPTSVVNDVYYFDIPPAESGWRRLDREPGPGRPLRRHRLRFLAGGLRHRLLYPQRHGAVVRQGRGRDCDPIHP